MKFHKLPTHVYLEMGKKHYFVWVFETENCKYVI